MRKFKKGYWLVLYIGFFIIFASLSASLLAAQKEFMEETPEGMETCVQEKTAKQESVFRSKFENLPAEYQERARRLGYKEGDMVEMRRDSSGAIVVLPPLKESKTPEQMREKLTSLIKEKIAQKMTDDVKVTAMLALDGTGHFTIRLKFETLYKELQTQAKKLGFRKGNTVEVRLDAATWKYRVIPKEKKAKFSGNVQEIIPPEEPGGSPSYRMTAKYSVLPKDQQKRAKKMGYSKKDAVRFIYREDTKEYKILPPPLKFAIVTSFQELDKKEQAKALRLGYKMGDKIWKTPFNSKGQFVQGNKVTVKGVRVDGRVKTAIVTKGEYILLPAAKVGSGPMLEITQVLLEQKSAMGRVQNTFVFRCVARFEVLDLDVQQLARKKGHKEGDKVRLNYDVKADKFEIKSSGVRKKPIKAPAAVKKTKADMDADAYIDRGDSYRKKDLHDKAISDYSKAIEINPKSATAYSMRGISYRKKDLYDQAISDYTKAIEINPKLSYVYRNRGLSYSKKGLYDKAIADFTKAIEINPKNSLAYRSRGFEYHNKGLYDKAISDYTKAIEINPKSATAYNNRAVAYDHKRLYDKAISDYTKAIDLNPKYATAYSNRGLIYRIKGLYNQSIADFNKSIQIDPKYVKAFYYKALSCEKAGRINEALEAYKTFIQNALPKYASYIEKAKKRIKELEK